MLENTNKRNVSIGYCQNNLGEIIQYIYIVACSIPENPSMVRLPNRKRRREVLSLLAASQADSLRHLVGDKKKGCGTFFLVAPFGKLSFSWNPPKKGKENGA
jgi:hypothetical protein